MTTFYHFPANDIFYPLTDLESAVAATKDDGFVWFNFYKPARKDINSLVESLGIHPLSVEDCFDDKQVPKMEHFLNNTFIIFNSFTYTDRDMFIDEIDIFISSKYLITVSGTSSGDRDPLNSLASLSSTGIMNFRGGTDMLMHRIIDHIVDEKYKAIDVMEDELEAAEESLLNDVRKFDPIQLLSIRRNLMSLRKSLFHEREILVKLCRLDCKYVSEKAVVNYRDVFDHLAKFYDLTETFREIETSLMELYTSLLNNHMSRISNETNASMRRLTLIATIFMPLTLIASIGGMSEWTMMTGQENWKTAYPLFIVAMIVIAVINFLLIKRIEKRKPPEV